MIFVPAAASPHKLEPEADRAGVRLEMLRAALEDEPGFELDAMELQRPPPSYAIDTVEALRLRQPTRNSFISSETTTSRRLPTWHRFDELSQMVQFVVLDRGGVKIEHPYPTIRRHLDISATDIRNRVATGHSIRYLVPPAVEKIIRDRQLYREPQK